MTTPPYPRPAPPPPAVPAGSSTAPAFTAPPRRPAPSGLPVTAAPPAAPEPGHRSARSAPAFPALRGLAVAVALVALVVALPARGEIAGRVVSASGPAVEQARVELLGDDGGVRAVRYSDGRGGFTFADAEPPAEVRVSHPRYRTQRVAVAAAAVDGTPEGGPEAAGTVVVLEPKQELYEEIVVSAVRAPAGEMTPPTVATSLIEPGDLPTAPATLTETVRAVPGVAESGQGGLFQVFSIRGISRQRVLTLVSGMRVTSERRAGVATSFLDPLLIGGVEVVRGPASTWYGSGALGGVVEVLPQRPDALRVDAGYLSNGDERYAALGWGNEAWSLVVAHRAADDAETPEGQRLFSRYDRTAAVVSRSWDAGDGGRTWELSVLPSLTTDIGKPNREFPGRTTSYPEEEHLMVKLSTVGADGSMAYVWAHPQSLETQVTEGGALNRVENRSLDLGADLQQELDLTRALSARVGVEYFGRRGVDAREEDFAADGRRLSLARTLDGAEQDEAAAYGSLAWRAPGATLSAGGRYTWQRQENPPSGLGSIDDTAWSGFVGAAVPLPAGFQVTANLGTGLRFPTLSERFFTGSTGRGEIVANPDLDPERSLNADLGLAWFGEELFVRGHLFRTEIDDYIERIRLPSGARTFVNLTAGTLEGVELEGSWQPARGWTLGLGGHLLDGGDEDGNALADVPPDRVHLTLSAGPAAGLLEGRLGFQVRAEQRDGVDDPGSGEVPISGATLLDASVAYRLRDGLELTLRGVNLTDETYLPSADELSVPAPGRGFGLSLSWTP